VSTTLETGARPPCAVSLRGVTKRYGVEEVLRGVDLDLPLGSVTALLGRNGAGKSTLLRIVLGLLARDGGAAEVLGRDPEHLRPADRARMAVVGDTTAAFAGTRVKDELALHRRIRGARWDGLRVAELLARFGVPLDKTIGALSKGLQARLRLVLALSADPELLILDEPALGLDLFARQDLLETIIETIEREGRAVLIVSHLIDDVERIADRVVFLRAGGTPAQGTVDELRDRYRRARVTLGPGGHAALEGAAQGLLGVRKVVAERDGAQGERVVVFDDFQEPLLEALEAKAAVRRVEVRRMSLREIYFEVLGGPEEEASEGRAGALSAPGPARDGLGSIAAKAAGKAAS
jgi:ABC-2 type transport system ATP-binding protein